MSQPFQGVRVLDATHVLAGPFATYQLAVFGAEVIKIEHPSVFDQARDAGTDLDLNRALMGTLYLTQASNKRSLTLDLSQDEGRKVFLRLAETADIVVENYRPGAFEKLGLGYDTLKAINPRIIYCSISAYGQSGPKAERTAYDHVVQATSGLMYGTGTPEVHPLKIGPPVIDYATGTMGAFALATALYQRQHTGVGQRIDLAMVDVALMMMGSQLTGYARNGRVPKPIGNRLQHATNWAYETKDGLVMLGAANLRQQKELWEFLGRSEMAKNTNEQRDADIENESSVLAELMLERTAQEWEEILQAHHIPAARVRTLTESLEDSQLLHRQLLHKHDGGKDLGGSYSVPLTAFRMEHGGAEIVNPPPTLGQDTEKLLSELGYTQSEIIRMRESHII